MSQNQSKFPAPAKKVKREKISSKATKKELEITSKGDDSYIERNELDPNAPPTKGYTVPLNEYELTLLLKISEKHDRSQRKQIRRFVIDALEQEAKTLGIGI
ncbi:hypothetical protein AVI51_14980 [Piscirickettsia salmonis]|uniref:Uncharacterized protein n=1 Tax=Piscirickettsia salmonis TaxID=1238 RepID=A0A9Q5YLI5_PISSA|nr:hypothetical protein [Piscirickettsia salmonis]ALA24334.1 hypothetical protein KW89_866 [Piscirickettsia salmonis]APS44707.1 hypothetical protein AVI48_10265 [Piscirickettsia salmonis]APS48067.1 hypothetical protein AVI49_10870 [Piscirickettsia salmonis]APS52023.1 hypothetical protein AVI50_15135 [Piscirickettsia salmonis]APS55241.1 hypothetical protein AVI51_14980 [Piscirickettsia salmonis]